MTNANLSVFRGIGKLESSLFSGGIGKLESSLLGVGTFKSSLLGVGTFKSSLLGVGTFKSSLLGVGTFKSSLLGVGKLDTASLWGGIGKLDTASLWGGIGKLGTSMAGVTRLSHLIPRPTVMIEHPPPMPSWAWREPTPAISNKESQPTRRPIGFAPWPAEDR